MTTPLQLECIKDVRYMGHVPQYKVRTLRGTRTIPPGKTGGLFMLPSMTHFRQEATLKGHSTYRISWSAIRRLSAV